MCERGAAAAGQDQWLLTCDFMQRRKYGKGEGEQERNGDESQRDLSCTSKASPTPSYPPSWCYHRSCSGEVTELPEMLWSERY